MPAFHTEGYQPFICTAQAHDAPEGDKRRAHTQQDAALHPVATFLPTCYVLSVMAALAATDQGY